MDDTDVWTPETITGARRRKFADKLPTQSIPDDWVEPFIQHVFEHHPQSFRCAMGAVVGLDDTPKAGRKRADG
jgi:hypothetical protein